MTSIGETLRRERLKRNLELGQISQDLKISSRMLAAIEDEKFDRLPGGVFSRSFVRQYARYLGLNEEEIAGQLEPMLDPVPAQPRYAAETVQQPAAGIQVPPVENWESVGGGRRFSSKSPLGALGMVVVAMLGCAGLYAWWSRNHRAVASTELPKSTTAAVRPVRPAATAATAAPTPATPAASVPQTPEPEENPNAAVRVELTAAEPVWVQVKSDGKTLFSGLLEANQSRTVDANNQVLLRLGNAGGVSISLNGKPIGTVGPKGQVRNVQLTSGGFEIVAPPKSPASLAPM